MQSDKKIKSPKGLVSAREKRSLDQGFALSQEMNDNWGIAQCLIAKGVYKEYFAGNFRDAEPLYAKGLELARELDDQLFIGQALGPLASCALKRYEYEHAEELFRESLTLFRQAENGREIAGALGNLAEVALTLRDYSSARSWAEESLALYQELEDKHGIATALRSFSNSMQNLGEYEPAQMACEQSVDLFRELCDQERREVRRA